MTVCDKFIGQLTAGAPAVGTDKFPVERAALTDAYLTIADVFTFVNNGGIVHGGLGGLTDDDHVDYLSLAGRSTQTINDSIIIDETSPTAFTVQQDSSGNKILVIDTTNEESIFGSGAPGDSLIRFDRQNVTNWYTGLDNGDSDALKISGPNGFGVDDRVAHYANTVIFNGQNQNKDFEVRGDTGTVFKIDGSIDGIGVFGVTPVNRADSTEDIKDALVAYGWLTDGGASPLNLDGGRLTAGEVFAEERDVLRYALMGA